jgi:hypothetical protein
MLSTKVLVAAMALVLQVAAIPSAQLKRQECGNEYSELVLNGPCVGGQGTCEFCCPPDFDATSVIDHCHAGHAPYNCSNGYAEWHCDDDH